MWKLMQHLEAQDDLPPVVIVDADDLLEDPEGIMTTAYCDALGLPLILRCSRGSLGPSTAQSSRRPSKAGRTTQNSSGIEARKAPCRRSSPPYQGMFRRY